MPFTFRNEQGRLVRQETPDYICDRLLELLEETPLHRMKVKQLTDYAGISRNTFYTYFDSIYAVVQRLEDEYLEGFFPEAVAQAVLVEGDTAADAEHMEQLSHRAHMMERLAGPNGDPYFTERLAMRIRDICYRTWEREGCHYSKAEKELYCSYITGGTIFLTRAQAKHVGRLAGVDLEELGRRVIAANNILFGFRPEA